MRDISLHLSDIIENSCAAGSSEIRISLSFNSASGMLQTEITDNGKGMCADTVLRVTDPFYTSRTTRKVGLGLPLFKANAEMSGGKFSLESELGKGTTVKASFDMSSVDGKPLGNLAEALLSAAAGRGGIRFILNFKVDENEFVFDTEQVKEILGGQLELSDVNVYTFLKEYLTTNINETMAGKLH